MIPDGAILLYDGTCGFCTRSVQFVLRHEHGRRTLRFAPLQSPCGDAVRLASPDIAGIDSIILWLPSGVTLARSDAALRVGAYLGRGSRIAAAVMRAVPRPVRDAAYDLVARYRRRLVPLDDTCLLPTPEERRRFITDCPEVIRNEPATSES